MTDTFTRQQWVEYTCGAAPVELKARMDKHIRTCADCTKMWEDFAAVERELQTAGAFLRESLVDLSPKRAFELWRQGASATRRRDSVSQRILRLQLFLTPICGFGTVQRAMLVAARRALAESVEVLTDLEWPAFVRHLSSIVGALCGEPAGRLLWQVGQHAA